MEITGWKVTTTGWSPEKGLSRRSYILTRSFERYAGSYLGEADDEAFEAIVRAKAADLS